MKRNDCVYHDADFFLRGVYDVFFVTFIMPLSSFLTFMMRFLLPGVYDFDFFLRGVYDVFFVAFIMPISSFLAFVKPISSPWRL